MLCTNVSWFLCTFVAAVAVAGFSLPASNTASSTVDEVGTSSGADLGNLLDDRDDAMVAVVAGDVRLKVHRAVLATRGLAFHRELLGGGGGRVVSTPDLEGPVLRQLVAYLYSLRPPRLPELGPDLLAAADRYRLPALKADLERQLIGQLSPESAVGSFYLATRHSCDSLQRATVAYIRAHFGDVFATRAWAEATEDRREAIAQLIRLLSDLPEESSAAVPAAAAAATAAYPATQPPGEPTTPGTALAGRTVTLSMEEYTSLLRKLDPEERTAMLMEAAEDGELVELEALQAAGADVRAVEQEGDGWTALHYAAVRGQEGAVRWLLAAGAAVNGTGHGWAWTPLHLASRWGHAGVVRLLLAAGADPSAGDLLKRTPLHWAAQECRAEAAAALLQAGADRRARDYRGKTALDLARWNDCQQVVRQLEA